MYILLHEINTLLQLQTCIFTLKQKENKKSKNNKKLIKKMFK